MSAVAHCAVMRNPFSTAVQAAKICDGSTAFSVATRYSLSQQLTSTDGLIYMMLVPNILSPLVYRTTTATGLTTIPYNFATSAARSMSIEDDPDNADIELGPQVPNSYRIVSQGLRLSLLNNATDNDGWFEAIRVNPNYENTEMRVTVARNYIHHDPLLFEKGLLVPEDNLTANTQDWSMSPGYVTGKLRDIHKHLFMLHREDDASYIDITPGTLVWDETTRVLFPNQIQDKIFWLDKKMDSVLIRIYANAVDDTTRTTQLAMHVHCIQHVEECYNERSTLSRFQQKTIRNIPMLHKTLQAIRSDPRASTLRIASMPTTFGAGGNGSSKGTWSNGRTSIKKKRRTTIRKGGRRTSRKSPRLFTVKKNSWATPKKLF